MLLLTDMIVGKKYKVKPFIKRENYFFGENTYAEFISEASENRGTGYFFIDGKKLVLKPHKDLEE